MPLYVESLYPSEARKPVFGLSFLTLHTILKPVQVVVGLYLAFIMVVPTSISSYTFGPALILVILLPAALVLVTIVRATQGAFRGEALLQMAGLLLVALAGLNDALFTRGISLIGLGNSIPIGFTLYMILQFVILGRRFATTFHAVEDLSINLEKKVVSRTLELNEKNEELEIQAEELSKQNIHITKSVRYASRIQKATLPSTVDLGPAVKDHFIYWQPKAIVSGDFYWSHLIQHPESSDFLTLIVVADCTGHGVPGAFMTMLGTRLLQEIVRDQQIYDPGIVLHKIDTALAQSLNQGGSDVVNDGMDISIVLLDPINYQLHYAGAKSPLLWLRKDQAGQYQVVELLKGSKFPVGAAEQYQKVEKVFETVQLDYLPEDQFYMYSDGYQDQYSRSHDRRYMSKKFRNFLAAIAPHAASEQQAALTAELTHWKEETPQTDDILVVGLTV